MMGQFTEDPATYHTAYMETVFAPRLAGLTREQAFLTLGACVKSIELAEPNGWPKHTGRLVTYDKQSDRVVVRSHEDGITEPRRVWTGTVAEYHAFWEVD